MELYRLKACTKCGGDLAFDEGDWICLQCGTYYYVGLYRSRPPRPELPAERWFDKGADELAMLVSCSFLDRGNVNVLGASPPAARCTIVR